MLGGNFRGWPSREREEPRGGGGGVCYQWGAAKLVDDFGDPNLSYRRYQRYRAYGRGGLVRMRWVWLNESALPVPSMVP